MDAHFRRIFVFDGGTFEPLRGDLRVGTTRETLRPRTATVLTYLLENPGRIIGREELIKRVWSNVVVTDDSLAQCIKEIRRALGGAADLIRTTPRIGYAFTGAVHEEHPATVDTPPRWEPHAARAEPPLEALAGGASSGALSTPESRQRKVWRVIGIAVGALAVALFALIAYLAAERQPQSSKPKEPRFSIVVLPLVNVGGGPAQEWFAEGVTEDLTTDLSRIDGSFVISRNSAYAYKGKPVDARTVGRELGVRYIVEGSVQRLGSEVVLNIRLIDSVSGALAWSERFAGPRADLEALQRSVTGRIARFLHLRLIDAEASRARRQHPANSDAHDLTMQGYSLWNRMEKDDNLRARELFQKALALDAEAAMAWAGLANTYIVESRRPGSDDRAATFKLAEEAAQRAYRIDPKLGNALGSWATVLAMKDQLEDAIAIYEERVRLNPNYAPSYYNIGFAYLRLGQPEKAIQYEEQAIRLSPLDARTSNFYMVLAHAHMQLGDAIKAIAAAEHGAKLSSPTQIGPRLALIAACVQGGQLERAEQLMREFRARNPKITVAEVRTRELPGREAYQQHRARFYYALRKAGLPEG